MKQPAAILAVTVLVMFSILLSTNALAQGSGFTVTSVSTSSVITKSTDPSTVYWIINTQFNGGGQGLAGTIDPDVVKSFMGGKVYTKQPISITVDAVNEQVMYNIVNEAIPIYRYNLQTTVAPQNCPLGVCYYYADAPACPAGANWNIPLGTSFWGKVIKRYCITKQQVGTKGVYDNPFIGFNAKMRITVGNTIKEKIICSGSASNCEGSSISFDELGTATWTGSLVTGESPPNQDNFVAILKASSNIWQIARKSTYESYFPLVGDADQKLNTVKNTMAGQSNIAQGDTEINDAITPVNNAADALLAEDTSFTSTPFTKDSNTGKVTITLHRSLTSPNVVFRLRADWIGIVIPTGKPEIVSVTAEKFSSGEAGIVNVQVKNVGEVAGTFSAMLVDCDPFLQSTTTQSARKTLQPGDVDTISIPISGGSMAEDITKQCSVKVYDVNEPSITTSSSVTLQMEKPKVCVPNKVFADGNTIKKCNADGSAIETVENCIFGIRTDGKGGLVCAGSSAEAKYECVKDSDCNDISYCNKDIHFCVQKSGCINIINNGDSKTKIDIAFIGDDYSDNEELRNDILKVVDFDGNNNGMMSLEPLKSNKNKFNIWMYNPKASIFNPDVYSDISSVTSNCPFADTIIVLSKKSFRSYAYFGWAAFVASGEGGRTVAHEFAHSFFYIHDEYVEPPLGDRPGKPNCAPDIQTAQSWWGDLYGKKGIGYFKGCSYTENNIRPTEVSMMGGGMYIPGVGFGAVNERQMTSILDKYK